MDLFLNFPPLTKGMIVAIIFLWVCFNIRFSANTASQGPTILTTLGIFATFLGIALGLKDFETGNVSSSVPALLDGLKTAFWGSVFGVGCALLLKARHFLLGAWPTEQNGLSPEEVTGADLLDALKNIQHALVGNEGSLVSQLKLGRQDTNDRLDGLKAAQTEALSKLSEMGTATLVEALRSTIKDFNKNLTEQFGENFKELNAAVHALVSWQEKYRHQVEDAITKLQQITDASAQVTSDYSTVVKQSTAFSEIATALGELLFKLNAGEQRLNQLSEGLARTLLSASGSLPEVERKITELTLQLTNAVKQNSEQINATLRSASEQSKAANDEQNRQLAETVTRTKQQAETFNRALEEALTKSLQTLADQLALLSGRFVEDYGPLVEELRNITRLARQANNGSTNNFASQN